jgi:NADH-quinone oxidoreductase subunit M
MTTLPLLTLMMVVPLVGAVVIAALPAASAALAKPIALGASLVTLVLACVGWAQWDAAGPQFQLTETHSWIPQFGVSYAVGVDGVALALIVMAACWHRSASWLPGTTWVKVPGRTRSGRRPISP